MGGDRVLSARREAGDYCLVPGVGEEGERGRGGTPLSAQSLTGPTAGVQFLDPAAEGPTGMDLGPASLPLGGGRNGVGVG